MTPRQIAKDLKESMPIEDKKLKTHCAWVAARAVFEALADHEYYIKKDYEKAYRVMVILEKETRKLYES
jgi:hypothetical protein